MGSMAISRNSMPRFLASVGGVATRVIGRVARRHGHARARWPGRARAPAMHATTAESMPPESPMSAPRKTAAASVVARAQHQRVQRRTRVRFGRTAASSPRPAFDIDARSRSGRVLGARARPPRLGVERQAGAVEHQVVLAADLVDEHQRALPVPRHGRQHARPQVPLLDGEGRGRDVDEQVRARRAPASRWDPRGTAGAARSRRRSRCPRRWRCPGCGPRKDTGATVAAGSK